MRHNFLIKVYALITALIGLLLPALAYAQLWSRISGIRCAELGLPCGTANPKRGAVNYIWAIIATVMAFTAVVAAGAIVYYGFVLITSRGNEENMKRAKNGLAYAISGLIIIGIAGWLVNAILNLV